MDPALQRLRQRFPDVARRVRLHETGGPAPSLDGVRAVVFWLADPLRERYPECHREAVAIDAAARALGLRVVNPPDALSNSVKSRQADLWRAAGIETPPVVRVESPADLASAADAVGFPLVLRGDEEHAQIGLHFVRDAAALAAIPRDAMRFPAAMSPLWDVRETWRARHPRSVYARLHHKKRAYVLGDRVLAEHVFFSKDPIVSAKSYTFGALHALPRAVRWMSKIVAAAEIREDREYWRGGDAHGATLRRAAAALGLGFAALDYSERADGSIAVWEANPYPSMPSPSRFSLPRERRGRRRLASYHDAVAEFLVGLLDEPAATLADGSATRETPATRARRPTGSAPRERLGALLDGYRSTCMLVAGVQLGLFERIGRDEATLDELVAATGAHAASLSRLLRGLAAIEVLAIDGGRYRLTPLGEGLLPGASQAHDVARLVGAEYLPAWADLQHSVLTGEPAFDHVFGMSAWRHRRDRPDLERAFQRFMALVDKGTQTALLGAYDFGSAGLIVDVGGGTGGILVSILLAHASARGIVFDLPESAADAARVLADAGVADRCTVASGSFLDAVPAGGDVYVLSRVLHDWDDERCRTILRACRVAMPSRGVLLIAESLLDDDGGAPVHLAMRDLHMLAVLGGQERTQAEYADLLAATGFRVARVTRGRGGPDVIEARVSAP